MSARFIGLSTLFMVVIVISGCSNLMGGLRRDLNDEPEYAEGPITGGVWPERGFLAESMGENGFGRDRYAMADGRGRGPASFGNGDDPGAPREGSWVGGAREEQNNRDRVRGGEDGGEEVSFNAQPNNPPASKRKYKSGNRATRADFIDESPNEGSLWASDGQTNYYFTKNKIRGIGDIVNLNIENEVLRDMTLEVKRSLNNSEKAKEVAIAQDKLRAEALNPPPANPQANGAAGANNATNATVNGAATTNAQNRAPAATSMSGEPQVRQATLADIDLKSALEIKEGDQVLSEIVERYPNGNYKIRGTKRIPYKNGAPRLMTITGIVKGSDIGEDDIVKSSKLYEYRLEALR